HGLKSCEGKVGAIGFCLGGKLAYLAAAESGVDSAVCYYGVGIEQSLDKAARIRCPTVMHFAEKDQYVPPAAVEQVKRAFAGHDNVEIFVYPGVDHGFNRKGGAHYDKPAAGMAHSRSIALLRHAIGPHYDLSALWDQHTFHEFGARDVAATMKTMVAE